MDGFMTEVRKIPPVTRFLLGSSLVVTIPVLMKMLSLYHVAFIKETLFKRFELWRLWTSFFVGSGGISYIFELLLLYQTGNQLESAQYFMRPADFAYQLLLACLAIIVVTIPLNAYIFFQPLAMCLVYLSSYLAPLGSQTNLFGFFTFQTIYMPYVMVGLATLSGGPHAGALAVAGIVVGHFWYWGVWGGRQGSTTPDGRLAALGRAPDWMRRLVGETRNPPPPGGVPGSVGGVTATRPRTTIPTGGSTAASSGTAGHSWGRGRTLGGS